MKNLKLIISSPEKMIFEGEVKNVSLPGTKGPFMILPNHAPIVSSLAAKPLSYVTMDGVKHTLDFVAEGFMEMSDNVVSVCLDMQNK